MTRILLIRHGQSEANLQKVFAGSWDCALTPLGIFQADLTARYLMAQYSVDRVYSSDLQRAYMTGKSLADHLGMDVIPVRELREIYAGLWERTSFDQLPVKYSDSYDIWLNDIGNAVCDQGESVCQLQNRALQAIMDIANDNPDQTVVVVTHGTPIRAIQCFCEGKSLRQMKDVPWVSNASVTELIFENQRLKIESVSYDAHLGALTSVLPANC